MSEAAPAPPTWAPRRLLGEPARLETEKVLRILQKFGGSKLQRVAAYLRHLYRELRRITLPRAPLNKGTASLSLRGLRSRNAWPLPTRARPWPPRRSWHTSSLRLAREVPSLTTAPLTMKDTKPQLWQAHPFCTITSRRHHARSPEGYIPADYHASSLRL